MANSTKANVEEAKSWYGEQAYTDKREIDDRYTKATQETRETPKGLKWYWIAVEYEGHILHWKSRKSKPSPPIPAEPIPSPAMVGAAFGPQMMAGGTVMGGRVRFNPPAGSKQYPGGLVESGPGRFVPGREPTPPLPPRPPQDAPTPGSLGFVGPAPPPPLSSMARRMNRRRRYIKRLEEYSSPEAISQQVGMDMEEEKQQEVLGRRLKTERMKRRGMELGGMFGAKGAALGGAMGEGMGNISGAMMAMRAGPVGMLAMGVTKSIDLAARSVGMANTLIDVTRGLKMAKYAATPLEEAQQRAAAQEKIPIIGKLLAGLTELSSSSWKAHYALREMASNMHEANMGAGKFSAEMAGVGATRTMKDIERSQRVGKMLAPSAAALEASESMLKNAMVPYETRRKMKQDIEASKDLLEEAEDQLIGRRAAIRAELGEDSPEFAAATKELEDLLRTRAAIKKLEKTGKWDGPGTVDYEDTLPGWMDGAMERHERNQEKGRPERFG